MHYIVPIIDRLVEGGGGQTRNFLDPAHRALFGKNIKRIGMTDTSMLIQPVGDAPDFLPQRAEFHDDLIAQPGVTFVDD